MYYVWVLKEKLAVSPMPTLNDIPELAKIFDAVVVLIEPHEAAGYIDQYLDTWRSYGIEVLYYPTPDFHPLELLDLYDVVKKICGFIESGGRVLVNCMGGIGRSGLVAASYLLYIGWSPVKAFTYIRDLRPGALESASQEIMFHNFYELLNTVDLSVFDKHVENLRRSETRYWRHASKTVQFIVELSRALGSENILREELVYAGLYHCLDRDFVNELFERREISNYVYEVLEKYWREELTRDTLILMLSHLMDKYMDSRVIATDHERLGGETTVSLICRRDCSPIVEELNNYSDSIARILKQKLLFTQSYPW